MDEQVGFIEQMDEDNSGPVILINKFNVSPGEVDDFLKAFAATGKVLMRQPGYISAQLHRGNAGSCVFLNYEVWESAKQFRQAVTGTALNFYRA
jgi:quinol monooxygenase YgiN